MSQNVVLFVLLNVVDVKYVCVYYPLSLLTQQIHSFSICVEFCMHLFVDTNVPWFFPHGAFFLPF